MTIFSNTIFKSVNKFIKFGKNNVTIQDGATVLETLNLCDVKINYKQYQKTKVTIPANTENYLLSFPMLGVKSTFIAIKAVYKNKNKSNNYLKWIFNGSMDPKRTMTSIMVLTGTSSNPIPNIFLDNLSNCSVDLEIIISGTDNDFLSDINAFIYLDNLEFTNIKTFNETNSGILAFYNKNNELVTTTDVSNIINFYKIPGKNRIVIDETSQNNIILDFKDLNETLQALSALNWLLLDPINRSLPKTADIDPPVITLIANNLNIDLSNYPTSTFTKADLIASVIDNIIDNVDGPILPIPQNIKFFDSNNIEILTINNIGNYTAEINVSDIAGNVATETINIEVQNTI